VVGVPNEDSAARRARWLAELADALEEARRLIKQLGAAEGRIDAVELYARIEAVRLEVQAMRLRRSSAGGHKFDREWTKDFPWRCSA
jgi:acyl-CoA reductase-like NAD-dependent aldehyde dehydrogenase